MRRNIVLPHYRYLAATLLLPAASSHAHHPMGGNTPETFLQGFLSGLGHPVIGADHLTFVLGLGVLAAMFSVRLATLAGTFIAATVLGLCLYLQTQTLPAAEALVALSVLLMGGMMLSTKPLRLLLRVMLPGSGLLHGYAYGEAILGAETQQVIAYIAGFSLIQAAIAILGGLAYRHAISLAARSDVAPVWCKTSAGAMVGLSGLFFLIAG